MRYRLGFGPGLGTRRGCAVRSENGAGHADVAPDFRHESLRPAGRLSVTWHWCLGVLDEQPDWLSATLYRIDCVGELAESSALH
jgi:hypothetical protein